MALIDIARNVLKQNNNRPMSAKEIICYIVSNNLWSPPKGGVTPTDTLAERIKSDQRYGKIQQTMMRLEDTTDHDEIIRILRKSKNDPTKRRARRRR